MMRLLYAVLFFTTFEGFECLRLLAFLPIPWRSHQFVFKELVRELGSRGHNVDFWTPIPMNDPPETVNQIKVHDSLKETIDSGLDGKLSMRHILLILSISHLPSKNTLDFNEFVNAHPWRLVEMNYDIVYSMIKKSITKGNAFQQLLRSNATYDIVITEFPAQAEPFAYLAHRFNALNVAICPLLDNPWVNELAGLPDNPSFMTTFQMRMNSNMNWLGRFKNAFTTWATNLASYRQATSRGQQLADEYIKYPGWEDRPSLMEVASDAALILLNSHPSMSDPYPRAPHVKEIGGIHIRPNEPLPEDIKDFMDGATDGVIYFSLGSNIDAKMLVENGAFDVFLRVFKQLKQRVLWKVSPGLPPVLAPNIKTQTWFPQQDVLAHEKTVLFIMHGGLQSTVETINYGVPALGLPVAFDQFKDVEYLVSLKMSVRLDINSLTDAILLSTINELIYTPGYREAAKRRQEIFQDRPMAPVEEAVYWIEYVGRHGKVLQPASAHMPFYQLYLLDVISFVLIVIFVTYWSLRCFLRRLYLKIRQCKDA